MPGNEVRVVDPATGTDVRPGEVGEFWVRSGQVMASYWNMVMASYWNMPEATREAVTPGGGLRAGDAGRIDEAGAGRDVRRDGRGGRGARRRGSARGSR